MLVNVLGAGAKGDGCCDDTAAINRALATGRPVFFPPGTYQTAGGHVLAFDGQAVCGVTADSCIIRCTSPDATIFTTAAYCTGVTYRDLRLTRSVPATGGYGIDNRQTQSRGLIEDVVIDSQWEAIALGATDLSVVRRSVLLNNRSHGLIFRNPGPNTAFQWTLDTVLSAENGGSGFIVVAAYSEGAGRCSMGEWRNLSTYGNHGYGLGFLGTKATPIYGVRIDGGFVGSDGMDEVHLDTYGGMHVVRGIYTELGRGRGIYISPNNVDVHVDSVTGNQHSMSGLVTCAQETMITASKFTNNGLAGIELAAGRAHIFGCRSGNIGTAFQQYGISITEGCARFLMGNDLTGNVCGPQIDGQHQ